MMYDKKLERIAKTITVLLLVCSVTMFVMCFVVQPTLSVSRDKADTTQNASVSPVAAVEPEITHVANKRKPTIAKPVERLEEAEETIEIVEEEAVETVELDPEEVELLAKVIYQEAGGDACCDECRRMVADVVLNRVADDRFPDTIYEVLMQERQYGRYHWTGVIWPERASHENEKEAVERAYRIAKEVLSGEKHSALYGQGYIWQAEFIQGTDVVTCECGDSLIYFGR